MDDYVPWVVEDGTTQTTTPSQETKPTPRISHKISTHHAGDVLVQVGGGEQQLAQIAAGRLLVGDANAVELQGENAETQT